MLQLVIPDREFFNEATNEFITVKGKTLQLEHSLLSISKWESKWHKPFLSRDKHTNEEMKDYVKCMTLTQNVDDSIYDNLSRSNFKAIESYIDDSMTATTFKDNKKGGGREIITSEIIYYWMISQNIPFECQKWHLNRLLTLIRVCSIKNGPQKKMPKKEQMSQQAALNAARRAASGSSG